MVWFVIENILKFLTGFLHSYFYYYPLAQITLLTIVYLIKAIIFSLMINRVESSIEYVFQLIINYTFFILNCFFVI